MRLIRCVLCVILVTAAFASPAGAQYRKFNASHRATGETWHVEFGVGMWKPPPDMVVSSEALGIIGSTISAQDDLGMTSALVKELHLVLRPAKKHKFRFGYIPISYAAETIMTRTVVYNGQSFTIGLPIKSSVEWTAWNFGYEYDFVYRDRGFVGLILEAKYTDVTVTLANPFTTEFGRVRAPIPTVGGIARVYPVSNMALTAEVTGIKLPTSVDKQGRYDGKYIDFNVYGTLNFTDNFGVQGGYRSLTVSYRMEKDTGDFVLKGPYIMGVVRY